MPEPYEPTPAEVKALMPARLDGEPFSDETQPTEAEVEEIIADVASEVAASFDEDIPAELHALAKKVVKEGAARDIERGMWPEQHDESDRATYARYRDRFNELLELLKRRVAALLAEDSDIASGRLTGGTAMYVDQ
jgi:hypothetical protein